MTLQEIIQKKAKRLEDIPELLITGIDSLQLEAYERVLELLGRLSVSGGAFVPNAENLNLVAQISSELRGTMVTDEYNRLLAGFAKEFDTQAILSDAYFTKVLGDYVATDFYKAIVQTSKRNAIESLISGLNVEYVQPIQRVMEQSVINNTSFQDTVRQLREAVLGTKEIDSKYLRYVKTWARETYAVGDRSYTSAVADDLGMEWFYYSGGTVGDSRSFCIKRHAKYFHRKEFEMWGSGKSTPQYPVKSSTPYWAGFRSGTNSSTIFTYLGGWNCMHNALPTSLAGVPKRYIERAIKYGYFKPTKVEQNFINNKSDNNG